MTYINNKTRRNHHAKFCHSHVNMIVRYNVKFLNMYFTLDHNIIGYEIRG